jgi:beta-N-acetylhexosaminidase
MPHRNGVDTELDRQLGQLFMVGFYGLTPPSSLIELIQREQVGGIILFSRNCRTASQVSQLTRDLQAAARAAEHELPLLIATDQENGIVQRLASAVTNFPGGMALGAANDTDLTRAVAAATGEELAALGINMNLAPDADVNSNPANPVIGPRSFGQDPSRVAAETAAAVQGYQSAGVIATLKHFPGHGDTAVDSHLALPTLPHTLERLEQVELVPFYAGIAADAGALMLAHLTLPQITADGTTPATLSAEVVKLARMELGFESVIMTDCLEMGAIAKGVGVAHGAVLALQAGADLVLISHTIKLQREAIAAAHAALASGALPTATVRAALHQISQFKRRFLSWDRLPEPVAVASVSVPAHQELRDRAYHYSTTLVRDDDRLLPINLPESAQIAILAYPPNHINQASDSVYPHAALVARVQSYHANTLGALVGRSAGALSVARALELAQTSDLLILVTLNARREARQMRFIRQLSAMGKPIIAIAASDPYDIADFPAIPTWLATYEYTPAALNAAVDALFGQFTPEGQLPITLPAAL